MFCCFSFISTLSFSQTANTLPSLGNVGVGTTAPNSKLQVVGNTRLGGTVQIDSTVIIKDSVTIRKRLTIKQDIKVQGKSVFTGDVKAKANLKVLGTAKMKNRLVVDSVARMKNKLVVDGLTRLNGDAKVFGNLKLPNLTTTSNISFFLTANSNGKVGSIDKAGLLSTLYQPISPCRVDQAGNVLSVWKQTPNSGYGILFTGKDCPTRVGIGIETPITQLDVNGRIAMRSGANAGFIPVADANGIMTWTDPATIGTGSVWQTNSTNPPGIYYNGGSVGIGTTKTTDGLGTVYKLSVAGDVRAESMEVSLKSTWPDYVFEKNYKLNTLADIEKYITKNKHLPNVPSAKEVKDKGINLGEMDAILLQKIEELTLYVIEQQKRLEELEEQLQKGKY